MASKAGSKFSFDRAFLQENRFALFRTRSDGDQPGASAGAIFWRFNTEGADGCGGASLDISN
jgi:hypothetical protein